jgi:hypothetical protein
MNTLENQLEKSNKDRQADSVRHREQSRVEEQKHNNEVSGYLQQASDYIN